MTVPASLAAPALGFSALGFSALGFSALGTRALRLLPPEAAHRQTIRLLKAGLAPRVAADRHPMLATTFAGLACPNPLGLAAGFDKNAEAMAGCLGLGFGFIEVGAVTPRPQPGNDAPRVFRLPAARAVINRYGFNNDGLNAIAARLTEHRAQGRPGIVGINLGANKDSEDRTGDYVKGIKALAGLVDFYTVNISSPNTPGLRALQDKAALDDLLARVLTARNQAADGTPVFLKIAPDLTDRDKADIAASVGAAGIDGLIISNTTITRPLDEDMPHRDERGGLSGAPLFALSTATLGEFYTALAGAVPLIGVGGIASPDDAYEKILKGARLIQLYTALIYEGPTLITRIMNGLAERLKADGFETVAAAVGQGL